MKKIVSMFLALAMCLSLSVTAFAVEEEPEVTNEPAVQTEVETEAVDEAAAQAGDVHVHDFVVSDAGYAIADEHTSSGHAYVERDRYQCKDSNCNYYYYVTRGTTTRPHLFRKTEYGVALGPNGETMTTYLYECRACDYYRIDY